MRIVINNMIEWLGDRVGVIDRGAVLIENDSGEKLCIICASRELISTHGIGIVNTGYRRI